MKGNLLQYCVHFKSRKKNSTSNRTYQNNQIHILTRNMQKTTTLVEHFQTSSKQEMTPIIEKHETKSFYENPYSNTLWATKSYNKEVLEDISTKSTVSRQKTLKRVLLNSVDQQIGAQHIESYIQDEPQRKKIDSPYRLKKDDFFTDTFETKKLACELSFIVVLQDFCNTETHYVKMLTLIKTVYFFELQKNQKLMTKIKSLAEMEGGELILFGNIDTMIDLNKLLISDIKKRLSEIFNVNINSTEFWTTIKKSFIVQKLWNFEISKILQLAFEKFKQLYASYAISHKKQMFFLSFIEQHKTTKRLVEEWFSDCDCEYELEYLFKLPIERVLGWPVFLERLIGNGKGVLHSDFLAALCDFQFEYNLYAKTFTENLNHHKEENDALKFARITSNPSTNSKTSSLYSSHFSSNESDKADMTLQEQKKKFMSIYQNMEKLKTMFQNMDLLFFVKSLYEIAAKWQTFVELLENEKIYSKFDTLNSNGNSMHGKYMKKLERQFLAVSRLQNNEISHNLVKNLNQMLGYCNKVQKIINNHYVLEKKQKNLTQKDAKYDAIMKQKLYLQTSLAENLPLFLQYCASFTNALTLRYYGIMLSYLEIMSGGAYFLQKETESLKNEKRELGDNFDILQLYTYNRFLTKNAVMDTWFEKDKSLYSKVFRRLFN